MGDADSSSESLAAARPLSPHLGIYKPIVTMVMSIAHRITGAALYVGVILLGFYLLGLALGPGAFATVSWIVDSFVGRVFVVLFSWALFHHLLGGVRHAIWDHLVYLDSPGRELLAKATLGGGVALTALLWIAISLFG
jgi:succinate dehydrogenase / fumarate reductase cytochrome b subunit